MRQSRPPRPARGGRPRSPCEGLTVTQRECPAPRGPGAGPQPAHPRVRFGSCDRSRPSGWGSRHTSRSQTKGASLGTGIPPGGTSEQLEQRERRPPPALGQLRGHLPWSQGTPGTRTAPGRGTPGPRPFPHHVEELAQHAAGDRPVLEGSVGVDDPIRSGWRRSTRHDARPWRPPTHAPAHPQLLWPADPSAARPGAEEVAGAGQHGLAESRARPLVASRPASPAARAPGRCGETSPTPSRGSPARGGASPGREGLQPPLSPGAPLRGGGRSSLKQASTVCSRSTGGVCEMGRAGSGRPHLRPGASGALQAPLVLRSAACAPRGPSGGRRHAPHAVCRGYQGSGNGRALLGPQAAMRASSQDTESGLLRPPEAAAGTRPETRAAHACGPPRAPASGGRTAAFGRRHAPLVPPLATASSPRRLDRGRRGRWAAVGWCGTSSSGPPPDEIAAARPGAPGNSPRPWPPLPPSARGTKRAGRRHDRGRNILLIWVKTQLLAVLYFFLIYWLIPSRFM